MGIEPWNNVGKRKKETILYDGITWGIKETPRRLSREFWPAFPLDSANGRVLFSLFTMLLRTSSPNCINCERGPLTNWIERRARRSDLCGWYENKRIFILIAAPIDFKCGVFERINYFHTCIISYIFLFDFKFGIYFTITKMFVFVRKQNNFSRIWDWILLLFVIFEFICLWILLGITLFKIYEVFNKQIIWK